MFLSLFIVYFISYALAGVPEYNGIDSVRSVHTNPNELKAAMREILLEDPSFVKSVFGELMREAHHDHVNNNPEQAEQILKLQEDVKELSQLKHIVTKQQERIHELENAIEGRGMGDLPAASPSKRSNPKSLDNIIRQEQLHKKNGKVGGNGSEDRNVSSPSEEHSNRMGYAGPNHVTGIQRRHVTDFQSGGKSMPKRLVLGEGANVAFCAYLDHVLDGLNPGQVIKYNKALLNEGNGYNTFTGVFSVPVSGVYMFTFFFDVWHSKAELRLVVDSKNQVSSVASHNSDSDHFDIIGGNTAIIRVNQGQSVWIETVLGASHTLDSHEDFRKTTFSGAFLYY